MNQNKKIAIVTGASRGIGKATAIKLMKLNYKVFGVFKENDEMASELEKQFSNLTMIKGDVGKENDVKKIIETVIIESKKIDLVINNTGINLFGEIEKFEAENWNKMIDTNLKSVFLFSKYSIPYLKKSDDGMIINVSSRIGFPEFVESEFVVYGITKAAINYFTVALSKELENTGIRVNAVIPTPTKTDSFDKVFTKEDEEFLKNKGKLGKPEEAADLVIKLIDDKKANGKILTDKRVYL